MKDPRYGELAKLLVHHSAQVKRGDKVLVEAFDIPTDFTTTLIRAIAEAGGIPLAQTYHDAVRRALQEVGSEAQLELMAEVDRHRMENVQCYVGIRGSWNIAEFSDVPREKMDLFERLYMHPVHMEQRVKKTRWVVLRWPLPSMAQSAGMSTEAKLMFASSFVARVIAASRKVLSPNTPTVPSTLVPSVACSPAT